MNEPNAEPIVLTPEQRTALGKVYQLILGWRQQRLQREAEAAAEENAQSAPIPASVSTDSDSEA
jgi:hypothetical protein